MKGLKLIPSFKDYIWGGTKLKTEFNKKFDGTILAESWELSCHKDGMSTIENGEFAGKTLTQYIENNHAVLGKNCNRFSDFPILIKLIDAKDNLSIQVHPNNEYALLNERQYGKTEVWYIVDCEKDACLYYGFNQEITKEEMKKRIENNTILDVLNKVAVKKGDVFFIEAGTIHAIGKNIVIAEIQQNSNVTYRVYDYGRVGADGKSRDLHIEKALEVSNLKPSKLMKPQGNLIAQCEYFKAEIINIDGNKQFNADEYSFHSLLSLEGHGKLIMNGEQLDIIKGDSIFIPANAGVYALEGNLKAILTTVPKSNEQYRIGIDLGGTNIKVGIVDKNNQIVASHSVKTLLTRQYTEIIKDMAGAVYELLGETNIDLEQCTFLGIGNPGCIDFETGIVSFSNNLHWDDVPLIQELKKYIDMEMAVSNDANCAALGEVIAGAAKGCKNAILLTLGTGVGGGIIIDGKVFEGGHIGGAEIGHTVIVTDGEYCTCGRHGCLEAYASATALIRETKKAAIANPNSVINELVNGNTENIDGIVPFEAAKRGDKTAKKVISAYIKYLGDGIVNMVNIFRPDVILLSGGVCNQGEILTNPLNDYVKEHCYAGSKAFVTPVKKAELGNNAGIIGAASLKR